MLIIIQIAVAQVCYGQFVVKPGNIPVCLHLYKFLKCVKIDLQLKSGRTGTWFWVIHDMLLLPVHQLCKGDWDIIN